MHPIQRCPLTPSWLLLVTSEYLDGSSLLHWFHLLHLLFRAFLLLCPLRPSVSLCIPLLVPSNSWPPSDNSSSDLLLSLLSVGTRIALIDAGINVTWLGLNSQSVEPAKGDCEVGKHMGLIVSFLLSICKVLHLSFLPDCWLMLCDVMGSVVASSSSTS